MRPSQFSVSPDGLTFRIPTGAEIQAELEELTARAKRFQDHGLQVVVVQGLGFVGTAVAAVLAGAKDKAGQPLYFVIGVDLPSPESYWKVGKVNAGLAPIPSPDPELDGLIETAARINHNLAAGVAEDVYGLADVIVMDVPLDVLDRFEQSPENIQIDLHGFEAAIRVIGRSMQPDTLILIETTLPAGTSVNFVMPTLKEERLRRGIDQPIRLAYSYERVMPGPNYVNSIRRFWRSFAGIDPISATKAREFLSTFIEVHEFHLWELESTTACELAKLLENSYRAVNIAFIHEWTLIAEEMEVNLFDIVESIHLRKGTHDNMRYPGFGVGGYCLTKDSLLAQWGASNFFKSEQVLSMTLAALSTNSHMPLHTFGLLAGLAGGDLAGKLIAVCGVSYLPEVPDTRNSPTEILVDELIRAGARVMVHDPCATTWLERPDVALTMNLGDIRSADGVVFAVPHGEYMGLSIDELLSVAGTVPIIVDANNIISDEKASRLYGAGCRLHGVGKGHWRRLGYHEWKVGNE